MMPLSRSVSSLLRIGRPDVEATTATAAAAPSVSYLPSSTTSGKKRGAKEPRSLCCQGPIISSDDDRRRRPPKTHLTSGNTCSFDSALGGRTETSHDPNSRAFCERLQPLKLWPIYLYCRSQPTRRA